MICRAEAALAGARRPNAGEALHQFAGSRGQ
jgi:hypothetical protein